MVLLDNLRGDLGSSSCRFESESSSAGSSADGCQRRDAYRHARNKQTVPWFAAADVGSDSVRSFSDDCRGLASTLALPRSERRTVRLHAGAYSQSGFEIDDGGEYSLCGISASSVAICAGRHGNCKTAVCRRSLRWGRRKRRILTAMITTLLFGIIALALGL